jgi:hypothetical protein
MVLPEDVRSELSSAQEASNKGNEGRARVCARRAVGNAFRGSKYWKEDSPPQSVNEILKLISSSDKIPAETRNAARRLSASVLEEDISRRPIEDALLIIEELLSRTSTP